MSALEKNTPVQMSAGFTATQKAVENSFGHVEGISVRNMTISKLQSSLKY